VSSATVSALKVIDPGSGMAVQDYGRPGYQRYGVTEGGAMDRFALAEVNCLCGNNIQTAAIEMIAMGGQFTATGGPVTVACSGAQMDLKLDGIAMPWRSNFVVKPGQILQTGYARDAIYSYLQCSGGFALEPVMNSVATHTRSGFGGFKGRILQAGDELPVAASQVHTTKGQYQRSPLLLPKPDYLEQRVIRIVWGPQAHVFSASAREAIVNHDFFVSSARDRMGARLDTEAGSLAAATGLSGVSDAVVIGDIQVAGDGVATVLLADRQPTGGYPRIATIITADLDAISQMPVATAFRFQLVTNDEAVVALRHKQNTLNDLSTKMIAVTRRPEDVPDLLSYNLVDGVINGQSKL